jgi:hypothetical protein
VNCILYRFKLINLVFYNYNLNKVILSYLTKTHYNHISILNISLLTLIAIHKGYLKWYTNLIINTLIIEVLIAIGFGILLRHYYPGTSVCMKTLGAIII